MNKTILLEIMNNFIGWNKTNEFTSYKFSDENAANEFSEITGGIIYGPFSIGGIVTGKQIGRAHV